MIVLMESFVIYFVLVVVGSCLGSFAGASVWRLRARQLVLDKKYGEKVDNDEFTSLKKLIKKSITKDRSQCLNCNYVLRWYDMIPVISWLSLRGKCRKCNHGIGIMELIIEITIPLFFVLSFIFWPTPLDDGLEITRFVIWLVSGVGLAILFVYDLKWFFLPNLVNFSVILLGVLNSGLLIIGSADKFSTIMGIFGSVLILSGLYWLIYEISRGKWIGFGDIKLGLGLGLLLADWKIAFIALFSANLIGCILVLPGMLTGKLKRDSHIPFGPLLIAGFIIAGLFGNYIISEWYLVLL